ncbi:MAG: winged helix-turn-helix domain-containing protein [Acidobacteria bacterium]|nr:winged helix-turn-helix domain-containing protein [Acidobacteriota bacterium]
MINQIGEGAGAVWKYLNEHSEAKPSEIKKTLKLNDDMLWMAIGWLAREDKLVFKDSGKAMQVSLSSR